MTIQPPIIQYDSQITLHINIKLLDDSIADSTRPSGKPAKIILGNGEISASFEQQLLGLTIGSKKQFELAAVDAFGEPNPVNIHHLPRQQFAADMSLEPGLIIAFTQPDGNEIPGIVRAVDEQQVTVDFNHPLCGQRLRFEVEILSIT